MPSNVLKFHRKRKPRKEASLDDVLEKVSDDILSCKAQVDVICRILRQNVKDLNKILKQRGKKHYGNQL